MGEAHKRITDYLNRFSDTVSSQDGTFLKLLLSLSSNSTSLLSLADALNIFQDATKLFFIKEFRNWDSAWALEALYVVAYEIRANRDLASNGKSLEKLKVAGSFLMNVFGVLALFKVYFKLGTIHLYRSVIKSIETARIFEFEEFPKRNKVTYMYYTVCLEVFNENFHVECVKEQEALIPLGIMRVKFVLSVELRLTLYKHKDHILLASVFLICFWFPLVSLRRGKKGSGWFVYITFLSADILIFLICFKKLKNFSNFACFHLIQILLIVKRWCEEWERDFLWYVLRRKPKIIVLSKITLP
ncbi:hypothetical protein UlMin_003332 [Ulmus minor]